MIPLEERNDIIPACPHCSVKLEKICFRELRGMFGKRYLYFCSHCTKVLGVSHRKGFWMG
jgi:DNA-directed RNA polymerase subunit RPC12/RpoP